MAQHLTHKKQRGDKAHDAFALLPLTAAEIEQLKNESVRRSGRWEIAQVSNQVSASPAGIGGTPFTLTLVVHQESYFVIHTLVAPASENNTGITAFIGAIRKDFMLPEEIAVRDRVLADEFRPLLEVLGCKLLVTKLKAVPEVLRGIKRFMR